MKVLAKLIDGTIVHKVLKIISQTYPPQDWKIRDLIQSALFW